MRGVPAGCSSAIRGRESLMSARLKGGPHEPPALFFQSSPCWASRSFCPVLGLKRRRPAPVEGPDRQARPERAGTTGVAGTTRRPRGATGTTRERRGTAGTTGAAGTTGRRGHDGHGGDTTGTGGRGGRDRRRGSAAARGAAVAVARLAARRAAVARRARPARRRRGGTRHRRQRPARRRRGTGSGATPSTGCGKPPPASMRYSIDVAGKTREYILSVPSNYDPNTPYRLIFGWHPWGGSASRSRAPATAATTGSRAPPTTRRSSSRPKVWTSGQRPRLGEHERPGHRVPARDARSLQVARCASTRAGSSPPGFSFGGMMSFARRLRGVGRAAIAPDGGQRDAQRLRRAAPSRWRRWASSASTTPWSPSPAAGPSRDIFSAQRMHADDDADDAELVRRPRLEQPALHLREYQGCTAGYPVIWCEYKAGHQFAPNSARDALELLLAVLGRSRRQTSDASVDGPVGARQCFAHTAARHR